MFAGSYHVARGGATAAFSFAELPHWPIHHAAPAPPIKKQDFWIFDLEVSARRGAVEVEGPAG